MAQLIVREVEEELVRALERRAARHGRSAEAEHRVLLEQALARDVEGRSFKAFLRSMPDVGEDADFAVPRGRPRDVAWWAGSR